MNPNDYQKVKEIFNSVIEIEPEGRGAFLDERCAGEDGIKREVERLLDSYESGFLERPAGGDLAAAFAENGLKSGATLGHYTILNKDRCRGNGRGLPG